jgi:hypothetical protein
MIIHMTSRRVILLAKITGKLSIENPYTIQSESPALNNRYILSEISWVDLFRHILYTWGTNPAVVIVAAARPMISI